MRVLARLTDANPHGEMSSAWIMYQIDIAGAIPAARRARGRAVTVAVNGMEFHRTGLRRRRGELLCGGDPGRPHFPERQGGGLRRVRSDPARVCAGHRGYHHPRGPRRARRTESRSDIRRQSLGDNPASRLSFPRSICVLSAIATGAGTSGLDPTVRALIRGS
jgi:hypothetical protein